MLKPSDRWGVQLLFDTPQLNMPKLVHFKEKYRFSFLLTYLSFYLRKINNKYFFINRSKAWVLIVSP